MGLNLLITGGLGYIGSFTAKNYLKNTKKKPFVIDNLSRGNKFAKKYSKSKILDISLQVNAKSERPISKFETSCSPESAGEELLKSIKTENPFLLLLT